MILYFADRQLNILGQASTKLPRGFTIVDDNKTEDTETGVAIFECKISFKNGNRADLESWAEVGNYLLRSHQNDQEFYQIIDVEIDTKKQSVSIYAEDDGLDLLNEVVGAYAASQPYPISHYINKYAEGAGWTIGINEIEGLTRQLSFDSEQTTAARILSIAEQFGGAEISYSFEISGLMVSKKYINIHQKRGADNGVQLRLNKEIDSITTTKSIANLATALQCTGGTPENAEDPVTLKGYTYDDGDFYVEGSVLKSRKALEKWQRYLWKNDETLQAGGHIVKPFSCDALRQAVLCEAAIEKLKTICDMEINFEADITHLPDNVRIGDRVSIIDDGGNLYVSTRILTLETSVVDDTKKAVLGEHLITHSGISQKVADLAAQFAKNSLSAARALSIANTAKANAEEAQTKADAAVVEAGQAQAVADEAKTAADNAAQSAEQAQTAANAAQAAVDVVEESVSSLEKTVTDAKNAADNAQLAADTATQKAEEAKTAANNAASDAAEAKESAGNAKTAADSAIEKADTAISTADGAKTTAEAASQTAEDAKADAEQAQKDIDALGDDLETATETMRLEYARKSELTETEATLQAQINKNAEQISSTVSRFQTIDETANDAAQLAKEAQYQAETAKQQAEEAAIFAESAQFNADNARTAAEQAQAEANTAQAAFEAAQSVANQAEADLAAAQADLATVQSRADATEAEIAEAQAAVDTAQAIAEQAKQDAAIALSEATAAQETASAAHETASVAQDDANAAKAAAENAQKLAQETNGAAVAADVAMSAALVAGIAQSAANEAQAKAEAAQATANEAAQKATDALNTAEEAAATSAQAAVDLETAQNNLAAILADVDSTEEEIAAAQGAVDTAQAAADVARANAEAAQAESDRAQTDAEEAQAAATAADEAARNAKDAADFAQNAATKAKEDVDALAVRMTTAETDIKQNADEIELRATKEEVTETLGGYYTKDQTEASIELSADGIRSEVSEVKTTADNNTEEVAKTNSMIEQLSNMIKTLVVGENGQSLMTQTETGWQFDFATVQNTLASHASQLADFDDHIKFSTFEGEPCIELGEKSTDFKVLITNKRILFQEGSATPTYICDNTLVTENIEVKEEMRQSGWVWKVRSNGNLGLSWKGVTN